MTARQEDINGWTEIKGNPLSKVGVFPYLGSQISPELEPNKIYNVYRPEQELNNDECLKSFNLVPFTDEHAMLGGVKDGLLPAEKKGVHGVIGENVYFENGYLKGNLKIFSEKLANLIKAGKKELSIGYRCVYDLIKGVYNGKSYDAIQRDIRGNHVALVDEGRSGKDVSVLDSFKYTFDSGVIEVDLEKKETDINDECGKDEDVVENTEMSLSDLSKKVQEIAAVLNGLQESVIGLFANGEKASGEEAEAEAEMENEGNEEEVVAKEYVEENEKKDGMDAAVFKLMLTEISKRDALASQLSNYVGAFDHKDKTLKEVAKYGIKKLKITCDEGLEEATLKGYLIAKRTNANTAVRKVGLDSNDSCSKQIDDYIKEGARI